MARKKISDISRDLNVSVSTITEYLQKRGITVENNPNTRVDDQIVDMLRQAFQKDKDLKSRADQIASKRQSEREQEAERKATAKAKNDTREIHLGTKQKPTFLGKIELDAKGNPVKPKVEAPKPAAPKADEAPKQAPKPAAQPVEKPAAAEKPVEKAPEKAPEKPTQPKAEAKQPAPKAAPEKVAEKPAEKPVEKAPEQAPEKPVAQPAKAAEKPVEKAPEKAPEKPAKVVEAPTAEEAPKADEPEIFTIPIKPVGPQINVVGKIDLDQLNQSMRPPKKKSSAERRKRKRIGKEKIDIENAAQQQSNSGKNQGGKGGKNQAAQGGGKGQGGKSQNNQGAQGSGKSKREKAAPRPAHVEVNEEDVQKQVKETLARLTSQGKGQKKGAKWRKEKRDAAATRQHEAQMVERAESKVLKLTEFVTANDLAIMMDVPINKVIATCMNIGVMVSINQRLDAETINIVADEFGFQTEYVSAEVAEAIHQDADSEEDLVSRPPIVTVMGHVDHGKTSLLDYIRNANVIAGEAGGITQHIGAYNVKLDDGRRITFLDTPGHEAFTAMRARGAKVTDLCIIIVAADDNVMPQTVEAINHASAAGVPMVFAINKIDKPHANPEKIKEELANMNYLVEDWGGKYQSQDISAKKGIGVNELMEKVLLEAEMLDLKANPNRLATGSIIESSLDKGRGYVATVLVQNGTLRMGDIVLAGTHFGKIRAMFNERNQRITEADPSTPVLILGLNGAPTAGDAFTVMETEQEAREIANKREQLQREQGLRTTKTLTLEDIARRRAIGNFQELNIIVKGDVDGSIEALSDSLIKLSTEEIQVNVLHKAVGEISESDITLAAASDAIIIGFQVRPSLAARRAAERDGVEIRLYSVIYQAIEEVKAAMEGMLAPEVKEEIIGSAEVLETYHISRVGTIAGTKVREGKIKRKARVRLIRDGIVKYTGELASLKRFKDDATEVLTGYECGMSINGYNDIKVGDIIECFEEVEVNRTL